MGRGRDGVEEQSWTTSILNNKQANNFRRLQQQTTTTDFRAVGFYKRQADVWQFYEGELLPVWNPGDEVSAAFVSCQSFVNETFFEDQDTHLPRSVRRKLNKVMQKESPSSAQQPRPYYLLQGPVEEMVFEAASKNHRCKYGVLGCSLGLLCT